MIYFIKSKRIRALERTSEEGKFQKEHIMEKTVLKKIIKAVRDLELNGYLNQLILSFRSYDDKTYKYDIKQYLESHLTKKTITKKFEIDDFKEFIDWDIKTPEQEAQENKQLEVDLDNLKAQIKKLVDDYNQQRQKLTINQDNYKYLYIQD